MLKINSKNHRESYGWRRTDSCWNMLWTVMWTIVNDKCWKFSMKILRGKGAQKAFLSEVSGTSWWWGYGGAWVMVCKSPPTESVDRQRFRSNSLWIAYYHTYNHCPINLDWLNSLFFPWKEQRSSNAILVLIINGNIQKVVFWEEFFVGAQDETIQT